MKRVLDRMLPGLIVTALTLLAMMIVPMASASTLDLAPAAPRLQATPAGAPGPRLDLTAEAQAESGVGTAMEPAQAPAPDAPAHEGRAHALGRGVAVTPQDAAAVGAAAGAALLVGLLAYVAFPFFSRIDSHRILDNGVRNRIHDAIDHNPGITIKEIVQAVGIGWGTAVYHLKRLEAEKVVVSERNRQFRRFFRNGGGIANESKGAYAELKNPTAHRLANELLQKPGAAQKDLCTATGLSAPLAHKYLNRMADAQLLTKQREWKTVKYFPTPRLAELLQSAPLVLA